MGQGPAKSEKTGSPQTSHRLLERSARARALPWCWVHGARQSEPNPCPSGAHILVPEDAMWKVRASGTTKKGVAR